ncbi:MAG: hypothetical protein LBB14_02040 [Puniceicoccales bacterium]|jgi:hypothetical protein|nr:hypothetical protein [Puniceicoccales bacterium]
MITNSRDLAQVSHLLHGRLPPADSPPETLEEDRPTQEIGSASTSPPSEEIATAKLKNVDLNSSLWRVYAKSKSNYFVGLRALWHYLFTGRETIIAGLREVYDSSKEKIAYLPGMKITDIDYVIIKNKVRKQIELSQELFQAPTFGEAQTREILNTTVDSGGNHIFTTDDVDVICEVLGNIDESECEGGVSDNSVDISPGKLSPFGLIALNELVKAFFGKQISEVSPHNSDGGLTLLISSFSGLLEWIDESHVEGENGDFGGSKWYWESSRSYFALDEKDSVQDIFRAITKDTPEQFSLDESELRQLRSFVGNISKVKKFPVRFDEFPISLKTLNLLPIFLEKFHLTISDIDFCSDGSRCVTLDRMRMEVSEEASLEYYDDLDEQIFRKHPHLSVGTIYSGLSTPYFLSPPKLAITRDAANNMEKEIEKKLNLDEISGDQNYVRSIAVALRGMKDSDGKPTFTRRDISTITKALRRFKDEGCATLEEGFSFTEKTITSAGLAAFFVLLQSLSGEEFAVVRKENGATIWMGIVPK